MNSYKFLKIIAIFLIVGVLGTGMAFVYESNRAEAISIGDVGKIVGAGLGAYGICKLWGEAKSRIKEVEGEAESEARGSARALDPRFVNVLDTKVRRSQYKTAGTASENNCLNFIKKYALEQLKKRVLKRLTQQTVQWIQGGGKPKFLTQPGDFVTKVGEDAIGETIEQLPGGQALCRGGKAQIRVQLQQPSFAEQVTCTLDDVTGNIQAFKEDFTEGGWIAYSKTMSPQNNVFGRELLIEDKARRDKAKNQAQAEQEAAQGEGFTSSKLCNKWVVKSAFKDTVASGDQVILDSPKTIPDLNESWSGKSNQPQGSAYYCAQPETVTPGSIAGSAVRQALGSDFNYVVNAEDLSAMASAITNALVNRFAQETIGGLKNLFKGDVNGDGDMNDPQDSRPQRVSSIEDPGCSSLPQGSDLRSECQNVQTGPQDGGEGSDPTNPFGGLLDGVRETLSRAQDTLESVQSDNQDLISALEDLKTCQQQPGNPEIQSDIDQTISQAETRKSEIESSLQTARDLERQLNNLANQLQTANDISRQQEIMSQLQPLSSQVNSLNSTAQSFDQNPVQELSKAQNDLASCEGGFQVKFAEESQEINEGEEMVSIIELNSPYGSDINVNFEKIFETAASGDIDKTIPSDGSATIKSGESSTSTIIQISDDNSVEEDEVFKIKLNSTNQGEVSIGDPATTTITIKDND